MAIEVDTSLPGQRVVRVLERVVAERGKLAEIITDNGPEITSLALDSWAHENGAQLHFIRAGKPTQNFYVESLNGKFRDDCLNENLFVSVADARRRVEDWRSEYNEDREHSSAVSISAAGAAREGCAGH